MSLPTSIDIKDIENLILADPQAVKTPSNFIGSGQFNPCHLAAQKINPRVDVLHLLKDHFPLLGESVSNFSYTPLHLAVMYSSNVEFVRELIQLYPPALEMRCRNGNSPLDLVIENNSPAAPQILQALLDAAPNSALIANPVNTKLPLHALLSTINGYPAMPETVAILLAAYRGAVNVRCGDWLPIHHVIVAKNTPLETFRMIVEENRSNISAVMDDGQTLAHLAVRVGNIHALSYILSEVPELLLCADGNGHMPLHSLLMEDEWNSINYDPLKELASPLSDRSEILRLILRHTRKSVHIRTTTIDDADASEGSDDETDPNEDIDEGGDDDADADADASEDIGTPVLLSVYKRLIYTENMESVDLRYPRRLLLLAGHPSLCFPVDLRELNYSARRGALFMFFHHPPSSNTSATIFSRIRNGPGSRELIRAIISFL